MKDTEFFERVLGLRELWSVKDIEMDTGGRFGGTALLTECVPMRVGSQSLGYSTVNRRFCCSVGWMSSCEPPKVKAERMASR